MARPTPIRRIADLGTFQQGVLDALRAAAEEHDRDLDEIICPANVAEIQTEYPVDSREFVIFVHLPDGKVYSLHMEDAS